MHAIVKTSMSSLVTSTWSLLVYRRRKDRQLTTVHRFKLRIVNYLHQGGFIMPGGAQKRKVVVLRLKVHFT